MKRYYVLGSETARICEGNTFTLLYPYPVFHLFTISTPNSTVTPVRSGAYQPREHFHSGRFEIKCIPGLTTQNINKKKSCNLCKYFTSHCYSLGSLKFDCGIGPKTLTGIRKHSETVHRQLTLKSEKKIYSWIRCMFQSSITFHQLFLSTNKELPIRPIKHILACLNI